MLSQSNNLQVTKNDKLFHFSFPVDAAIGDIHDALVAMKSFVAKQILAIDQAENNKSEACNGNAQCQSASVPSESAGGVSTPIVEG